MTVCTKSSQMVQIRLKEAQHQTSKHLYGFTWFFCKCSILPPKWQPPYKTNQWALSSFSPPLHFSSASWQPVCCLREKVRNTTTSSCLCSAKDAGSNNPKRGKKKATIFERIFTQPNGLSTFRKLLNQLLYCVSLQTEPPREDTHVTTTLHSFVSAFSSPSTKHCAVP